MFFPYSDDNPTERFPLVTITLLAANGLISLYLVFTNHFEGTLEEYAFYASSPTLLAMFTSTFLHAGPVHLIGNMWVLWIFGDNVEDRLGHVFFLLFYLACAFAGDGLHALFVTGEEATRGAVGASGAIFGVLAAYLIFHPWAKINFFYWLFIVYAGVVQIPAAFVIGFWFVEQFALALLTYGESNIQIGYWAHLGGFGLGLVTASGLRLAGVVRTPKDILLQGSEEFRQALEAKQPGRPIPIRPGPLKERMREGVKMRTTTVAKERVRKERQLLLRAIEQNQPEKVVKYYSLFEQAFPTLVLPGTQQWKAAQMLDAANQDALALEAYRKLVDHYPTGEHWRIASLRTGQLYHLHHNYSRAKQYLQTLLRKDPSSPEAETARSEIATLEATLAATEVRPPGGDERPSGSYLMLRQTFEKIDAPRVADVVAEVTGELKIDARARVVRGRGVIAEGLILEQARTLTQRLQAIGVPVLMVSEKQLLVYLKPVEVRAAELSDAGAVFHTYDQDYSFKWSNVWLINCSRVRLTHTRERTRSVTAIPMHPYSVRPLARSSTSRVSEEKRVRVLDLFLTEPFLHLRIDETRFNYSCLPEERKRASRSANFPFLVKDIIRWASGAHVGPGVDRLLSEESFADLTFASLKELERYNFWLVQLCNLKPGK